MWHNLPVCATLGSSFLSCNKFDLNICLQFAKFTECQTVLHIALKPSPNADIRCIWKDTSNGPNLQYDTHRNTKGVLKLFRCKQEERLKDHLVSQGYFFSTVISQALPKLNSL